MKGFHRYVIVCAAGFILGWGLQSVMGITLRKTRNSAFLAESAVELSKLRQAIGAYKKAKGRFPKGPGELYAAGLLDPSRPPREALRNQSRWVNAWDGQGGFLYFPATGEAWLNADVSREKFLRKDWQAVLKGDLFPKGGIL